MRSLLLVVSLLVWSTGFAHAAEVCSDEEVRAVEHGGQVRAPTLDEQEGQPGPPTQPACAQVHHVRCGMGYLGLWFLGGAFVVFLAIPLGIVWLVRSFQRMRARHEGIAEPISLLVAERLARALQRRGGVRAAVGITGGLVLVGTGMGTLAILSTALGCVGLRGFFVARAALQMLEPAGHDVVAEALGPTVVVRGPDGVVWLDVTSRALAAARRHAVPTSIARRR